MMMMMMMMCNCFFVSTNDPQTEQRLRGDDWIGSKFEALNIFKILKCDVLKKDNFAHWNDILPQFLS